MEPYNKSMADSEFRAILNFKAGKMMKLGLAHTGLTPNGFTEAVFVGYFTKAVEDAAAHEGHRMAAKLWYGNNAYATEWKNAMTSKDPLGLQSILLEGLMYRFDFMHDHFRLLGTGDQWTVNEVHLLPSSFSFVTNANIHWIVPGKMADCVYYFMSKHWNKWSI